MTLTKSETTDMARAIERTTTIDLSAFVDGLPAGTTAEVSVTGDRSRYVLEFARRDDRWTLEGAGDSAELTAVYATGNTVCKKPERVPGWITAVMEEFGVTEVRL